MSYVVLSLVLLVLPAGVPGALEDNVLGPLLPASPHVFGHGLY